MDNLTVEQRKKNMQNIRSVGSKAEQMVMQELSRRKISFSKNVKKLPGKPDIVFMRKKIAVFIDSDFWHYHPDRFIMPKTNEEYWKKKITRNKERDSEVNQVLINIGWHIIRLWEYDVKKKFDECILKILTLYNSV